MNMLATIAPFAAVFVIYNFVDHRLGLAALAALLVWFFVTKKPTILMLRGNSMYNKGDRKGGLELMEKAYKTGKLDANMIVYYSYCLLRENEDSRADEVIDEYIASGKGSPADICRAKHNKAIMLWKRGKTDKAFELMKEVHAEIPASDTYGTLGLIYLDKEANSPDIRDEALAFMREAYDYNSDDRTIASNLGEMLLRTGELSEAEEVYRKILETKPNSPTPYYNYARLLIQKQSYADAEDMLNHALRHSFTGVTAIKREDVTAALAEVEAKLEAETAEQA